MFSITFSQSSEILKPWPGFGSVHGASTDPEQELKWNSILKDLDPDPQPWFIVRRLRINQRIFIFTTSFFTLIMSGVICRLASVSRAGASTVSAAAWAGPPGVSASPSSPSFLPRPGLDVERTFPEPWSKQYQVYSLLVVPYRRMVVTIP